MQGWFNTCKLISVIQRININILIEYLLRKLVKEIIIWYYLITVLKLIYWIFKKQTSSFEIIHLHAVLRNTTERFFIYFSHFFPPGIILQSYSQYHNQDIDINTVKIQNKSFATKNFLWATHCPTSAPGNR